MGALLGRPPFKINWDIVNDLLVKGCSGRQIAGFLDIHQNTLYEHCVKDKGETFTDYSDRFHSKGESLIKAKQFDKAMEGDNTCLIWLGKVRCDQVEKKNITINNNNNDITTQKIQQVDGLSKDLVPNPGQ